MARYDLVIGNMNYSSWSMRGGLIMAASTVDWQPILIPMYEPDTATNIRRYSPSGKMPCLIDHQAGDLAIWDSLAIAEYMAENHPEAGLWPSDRAARAVARSVSAEMHSGFTGLRSQYPMNIRRRVTGIAPTDDTVKDINRIANLWRDCRQKYAGGGKFLFGKTPCIADWFYAPIVTRFITYGVALDDESRDYVAALVAHPIMARWLVNAQSEVWSIAHYDQLYT